MNNQIGGADKLIMIRLMSLIPDFIDDNNNTILHDIVNRGDESLVSDILIKLKNNDQLSELINMKNSNGDTPLHIAVRNQYQNIAGMLVMAGADTKIEDANGNFIIFEHDSQSVDQKIPLPEVKEEKKDNLANRKTNTCTRP